MSLEATFVIAGLMVVAVLFVMAMFARLYRKAGPHQALIVYGFRGTRIIKGRGTRDLPMLENCRAAFARADVVRRRAAAGPLHEAGRRGHRRGCRADQGQVRSRIHSDRCRAVPHQDRRRSAKA